MDTKVSRGADGILDTLVTSAVRAGTPMIVADEARRATLAILRSSRPTASERERAEAYFWGVVRRRALAGRAPAIARLIVAASLASELTEAGHSAEAVARAII